LTNPRPDSQYLWNWQQNEAKGIDILRTKRADAVSWVDSQRAQMHAYRSGLTPPQPDLPIPAQTYGNEAFGDGQSHPPEDACTIQAYNLATLWVLYWDIDGHQWQWRTDGNAAYVINVCNQ
jgi:hypothetical protein